MLALLRQRPGQGQQYFTAVGQEHYEEAGGRRQTRYLRHQKARLYGATERETVLYLVVDATTNAFPAYLPARQRDQSPNPG